MGAINCADRHIRAGLAQLAVLASSSLLLPVPSKNILIFKISEQICSALGLPTRASRLQARAATSLSTSAMLSPLCKKLFTTCTNVRNRFREGDLGCVIRVEMQTKIPGSRRYFLRQNNQLIPYSHNLSNTWRSLRAIQLPSQCLSPKRNTNPHNGPGSSKFGCHTQISIVKNNISMNLINVRVHHYIQHYFILHFSFSLPTCHQRH
ncbi:hypothetical protein JAB1_15360 [Janthinobacterium sp. MP5059B]|nr:hypothetical protein JAB1_15360 [Janthinobacterium sp. MP5059B]